MVANFTAAERGVTAEAVGDGWHDAELVLGNVDGRRGPGRCGVPLVLAPWEALVLTRP